MSHIDPMLRTHPHPPTRDVELIASCAQACMDCAAACNACADACLAEAHVAGLVQCIRFNRDCSDLCLTTGLLVSRITQANDNILRNLLAACVASCNACGEECEKHADVHEHCRICADACAACETACQALLDTYRRLPLEA